MIDSKSLNTGKVKLEDTFGGASKVVINGKDATNQDFISKKTKILLKYHIKKILGLKTNKMFEGIEF